MAKNQTIKKPWNFPFHAFHEIPTGWLVESIASVGCV